MALVLGLESSCDETAVALLRDGRWVLAERVASQAEDFAEWGGVVPELAARAHVACLPGLVEAVLREADCAPQDIDGIAVAAWPGLFGSLLSAVTCGKMLALRLGKPLLAVDRVAALLAAVQLGREAAVGPFVGLVASGGHSHYYRCTAPGCLELLGGSIDDAAGEAFDKAAAMLELGYPGGPLIDQRAREGDPRALDLPRPFLRDERLALSFAGLKTALLYRIRGPQGRDPLCLDAQGVADACASFQAAVVDCLIGKLRQAAESCAVDVIAVGGGVACNSLLRERLWGLADERGYRLLLPEPRHCLDNAAMIAALGEAQYRRGDYASPELVPVPTGARR